MKMRRRMNSRGFTMAELLIVVAIVAALIAITVVSVGEVHRRTKQMELDRLAENMYSAAQNQLTLRAARFGKADDTALQSCASAADSADAEGRLHYVAHIAGMSLDESAASLIFPDGSISEDLRGGSWLIEFDPLSYSVSSAFVVQGRNGGAPTADDLTSFASAYAGGSEALRGTAELRKTTFHGTVGFYNGDAARAADSKETGKLGCMLNIDNKEKLSAELFVRLPSEDSLLNKTLNLQVKLTVTGKTGTGETKSVDIGPISFKTVNLTATNKGMWIGDPMQALLFTPEKGKGYTHPSFVLDSLESGKHFAEQYPGIVPGGDITVKATVECISGDLMVASASDEKTNNSLFAEGSNPLAANGTALIEYGRHLQNLNAVTNNAGFRAVQTMDLNMAPGGSTWGLYYGESFTPIENAGLLSYSGGGKGSAGEISGHAINGLAVNGDGVFKTFSGTTLSYLALNNCTFSGSGATGFIGTASGELSAFNCTLSRCEVKTGAAAGGLVGSALGDVKLVNCKSENSTVEGGNAAGGLVGTVLGTLEVKNANRDQSALSSVSVKALSGDAGGIAGSASGKVSLDNCKSVTGNDTAEDKAVISASGCAGGLVGAALDELEAKNCELRLCDVTTGNSAEAAGALVGKASAAARVSGCKAELCTVTAGANTSAAGALAGKAGGTLAAENCTLIDCAVSGAKTAGGVAGSAAGSVEISGSKLYMEQLVTGNELQSKSMKWMSSTGVSGGLVGDAAAAVSVADSFAATVVKANSFAGGLVGRAAGKLTVNTSYADCYLGCAGMLGGLAGSCGSSSSFTACYAGGFVFTRDGGVSASTTAAGFVPANASVTNSYSIFCFDDGMFCTKVDKPDGGKMYIPTVLASMTKKYALTTGGSCTNAFFTYPGLAQSGAEHIGGEALREKTIPGFLTTGGVDAHLYGVSGGLSISDIYPYPTLAGKAHYNDFYVPEAKQDQVNLYRVSLRGEDYINLITGSKPYATTPRAGDEVSPMFSSSVQRSEVFVGWLDADGYEALQGMEHAALKALCGGMDGLAITNGCFACAEAQAKLGSLLSYVNDGERMKVDVKNKNLGADENDQRLYAVYRQILPFDVTVNFMSFDEATFLEYATDENNVRYAKSVKTDVTSEKYLSSGFAVCQNIIIKVNPLKEGYDPNEPYVIQNVDLLVGATGYQVVTPSYLRNRYEKLKSGSENGFVSAAGFDFKDLDNAEKVGVYKADENGTLTLKQDRARSYSVICAASMPEVEVKLVFRCCEARDGGSNEREVAYSKTGADPWATLKTLIDENTKFSPKKEDGTTPTFTAKAKMTIPPGVYIWPELPVIDGFKIDADHIENQLIEKGADGKFKSPVAYYDRMTYTLAFDLNGGICTLADGKTVKTVESITDMHAEQGVREFLPVNEKANATPQAKARGYLTRPGYVFSGWMFYHIDDYVDDHEIDHADGKGLKKINRNADGQLEKEFYMPADSIIAVAQWEEETYTDVRVEIYVQNVTDYWNTEKKTYSFYTKYEVPKETLKTNGQTLGTYKNMDYSNLLKTAYTSRNNTVALGDDDREYLRHFYRYLNYWGSKYIEEEDTVDGTIKNPRLAYSKKSFELDESGVAVFKVFYDRKACTFEFEYGNQTQTIKGLYEQSLSLAYEYEHDSGKWEMPGDGDYCWRARFKKANGKYEDVTPEKFWFFYLDTNTALSYLSTIYYEDWIRYCKSEYVFLTFAQRVNLYFDAEESDTLKFVGEKNSNSRGSVKFYLEESGSRNSGGIAYQQEPAFVWNSSGNDFTLNEKFDGYSICAYSSDGGKNKIPARAGDKVSATNLCIYHKRNEYSVVFMDVEPGRISDESYLYGQTISSLPYMNDEGVSITPEEEARIRPAGMESDRHFRGWYTESNGGGRKLVVDGGKVYAVNGNEKPEEYKISSSNLNVFAKWSTDEVKVKFYSRLPGVSDEKLLLTDDEIAKQHMEVFTRKVNLYDQIKPSVFNELYGRWAASYNYAADTETFTAGSKTYEFDGWYRYTGVPDHDERLTNRFYGDEYLTTPDDFTLAAQWKQKTGLAPYYIVCVLRDDDGTSRTIPLEGAQGEWEIGTALRIPAPSTTQFPELDGYYPLKSMGSIKNFQPGTDDTVTFYYRAAVRLPYYIDYQVTLRDVDNSLDSETIVFFTEDHLTSADNVFVMANDEVEGFRLDPEIQDQREITKATDSEGKEFMSPERVSFSYALGAGSIRAVDGEWKKGTDQYPSLLQIVNGTKNKLDCLSENRVLRVRYTLGVTTYDSLDDLLRTGNALAELDAGTYGVTVSLELWRTDEAGNPASRVLTAYRGTSTVTVSES